MADRIERRIGERLTDDEVDRLSLAGDPLVLRETWFHCGGYLVVEDGRLRLSRELRRREPAHHSVLRRDANEPFPRPARRRR